MKPQLKNYLSLTKKEWNGMVVLIILIALVLTLPYAYGVFHKDSIINFTGFNADAALLSKAEGANPGNKILSGAKLAHSTLFDFNPNNLPAAQWQQLGLSDKQISIIKNYEAKGGHFYKNTDLQKIYGITPADYKRLEPYIDIPQTAHEAPKLQPGATIDLNTADSAKLTQVRGIGPGFAMRIVRYRGRLGGFYRAGQLKEIFGVDSSKYAEIASQLSINPAQVTRLDINSISFASLRQFPYLTYKQASAVIAYRQQHGRYASIADIKNVAIIDGATLQKIEPYLSFK
jgi:competence protein ComEA